MSTKGISANRLEVDENTDIIKKGDIVNFLQFKEALI